jgi:putative tryptophan/tyrosine transport system substrate-binding protein
LTYGYPDARAAGVVLIESTGLLHARLKASLAGADRDLEFVSGHKLVSAFTQALADLGWTDGRNVRMDFRWAGGDTNRIRALARELVGLQPDIILAGGTPQAAALQRETRTIPIVFVNVGDPLGSGLVARLNRPSGNVTGFALGEPPLGGKWLQLLLEIAPGLKRVAIMFNSDSRTAYSFVASFETAARSLKVVPIIAHVRGDAEIEYLVRRT